MENNSIKSNLSKEDMISDIVLCIGADIYRDNIYLIVEGEDDISILKDKVSDKIFLYESYDGKIGVEYIVNNFFQNKKNVIGIRDKDYEDKPSCEKIFFYDNCCMEMMIIANDDAFHSVTTEYYSGSINDKELRTYILEELKMISIIRMLNEQEQWGITIKGISINKAFDKEKRKINYNVIVDKLNTMNSSYLDEDKLQNISVLMKSVWKYNDFLNRTQGHDFTTLFATVCSLYKCHRGISYKNIEAGLRCAFRLSDFKNTDLYANLINYQNKIRSI